jgi:hypothetical protein
MDDDEGMTVGELIAHLERFQVPDDAKIRVQDLSAPIPEYGPSLYEVDTVTIEATSNGHVAVTVNIDTH